MATEHDLERGYVFNRIKEAFNDEFSQEEVNLLTDIIGASLHQKNLEALRAMEVREYFDNVESVLHLELNNVLFNMSVNVATIHEALSPLVDSDAVLDEDHLLLNAHSLVKATRLDRIEYYTISTISKTPNSDKPCPRCDRISLFVKGAQVRAGDEAASLFYECLESDCRHQFVIHR